MAGAWLKVLDGAALDEGALHAAIVESLAAAKVLRIVGVKPPGDPLAFWRRAGESLGRSAALLEDSDGVTLPAEDGWMDVRFDPDRLDTYRHANVGQPLHTDGAYNPVVQDIGLFYLERQASSGGHSLFVDAASVAERAAQLDPDLLARLLALPMKFGKGGKVLRTTPVLREAEGRLLVNWNAYRVMPDQGEDAARLHGDFQAFLDEMVRADATASFRLQAGDAIFFRDEEALHGRRAYAAEARSDRLLWKTYFITPGAERLSAAA